MELDISVRYLLKGPILIPIILTVFYLGWKDNQENAGMFYMFIGCIIGAITLPFSVRIIQKMVMKFTEREFW